MKTKNQQMLILKFRRSRPASTDNFQAGSKTVALWQYFSTREEVEVLHIRT